MNWLSGYGQGPRRPPPPITAPVPPAAPAPGPPPPRSGKLPVLQTLEMVEVPVCPKCRSRYLRIRHADSADAQVVKWECGECDHQWRGVRRDHIASTKGKPGKSTG